MYIINYNKNNNWTNGHNRNLIKIIVISFVSLLVVVYLAFIFRQHANIIFESQFLHIDFLKEISNNKLTGKGFFTAYGEHVFAGYNILIAANYYLFNLWGGFDEVVFSVNLIITAVFIAVVIFRSNITEIKSKILISSATSFLLLSLTNNPQWGMALAASIGVVLFIVGTWSISIIFDANKNWPNTLSYLAIVSSIILFLGGYSIGVAGAFLLFVGAWVAHNRILDFRVIIVSGTVLISILIYALLANHYGSLSSQTHNLNSSNFFEIYQFGILMIGSSLIGKAFFEQTQQFWPYYLCGVILLYWYLRLLIDYVRKPSRERMFIVAISTYSFTNICAVAVFRHKNGIEGALGQWYNFHTHFIGVAVLYFLLSSFFDRKITLDWLFKTISILIIIFFAIGGYYCDWEKSKYVSDWKKLFIDQAPFILAFPNKVINVNDPMNTMLWNYYEVKSGIDFIYSKSLWIFKKNIPYISGLSNDKWLQTEKPVIIICPNGSNYLSFKAWRPDGWKKSFIEISQPGDKKFLLKIDNTETKIEFSSGIPAVFIDGSNVKMSSPTTSATDPRNLVSIISNITCSGRVESLKVAHLSENLPLTNAFVKNW